MWKALLVTGLALWLVGCDLADEDNHTVKVQVAAHQVTCTGVTQQRCYQVRFADGAPWQLYYGDFKGFDYQPGFQYWLEVHQQQAVQDNPEHSRLEWELVKEISRTPVAATSADTAGTMPASAPATLPEPQGTTMPAASPSSTTTGTSSASTTSTPPAATSAAPATDGTTSPAGKPAPTDDDIPPD